MMNLSFLFAYNSFSLSKFFFGNRKNQEKIGTNKENKKFVFQNSNKYDLNEEQKKLIIKLEISIKNFLFRKKVKNLIKTSKENYILKNSSHIPDIYLNIITFNDTKKYNPVYEPLLNQNLFFLPKNIYKNKRKLKFIFSNFKNETFIDPYYQIEYENCFLVNVLNLQEIKKKENRNKSNFKKFLNEYTKINKSKLNFDNKDHELNIKKEINFNNNINDINNENSLLKNNNKIPFKLNPILKERKSQRTKNKRKITFGTVKYYY